MHTNVHRVSVRSEFSAQPASGEIQIQYWDSSDLRSRSLRYSATCFGLACASLFLPIAHFVLVPGFLMATPLVFYWVKRQKSSLLGGQITCPCCATPQTVPAQPNRFPISDICSKCRKTFEIRLAV